MASYEAARRCSDCSVMAGIVASDTADEGALQASLAPKLGSKQNSVEHKGGRCPCVALPTLPDILHGPRSTARGFLRWKPKARLRVLSSRGETCVEYECVMKDELTIVLDAMRAAQAELGDYLGSADRNAELTIARLVGILDRREVVKATRLLRPLDRPGGAPERTLAEAS
jgi:hypothetical protein